MSNTSTLEKLITEMCIQSSSKTIHLIKKIECAKNLYRNSANLSGLIKLFEHLDMCAGMYDIPFVTRTDVCIHLCSLYLMNSEESLMKDGINIITALKLGF